MTTAHKRNLLHVLHALSHDEQFGQKNGMFNSVKYSYEFNKNLCHK